MADLRLGPSIQRITILTTDASGQVNPTVIYESTAKKKKGSRRLKPVESGVRRAMESFSTAADDYLARHDESNTKERDGWLMEMPGNVYKAVKKGSKRMKMNRVMSMMPMRM
jgi:hypothetical protein